MNQTDEIIRLAVHRRWDPIGVSSFTDELGEYDSYIPGLIRLLQTRPDEQKVFDYLWTLETVSMGLNGDRESTRQFAKWLCDL